MEENLNVGLDENVETPVENEKKSVRAKKAYTAEEVAVLMAGVEKLKELGVEEKTIVILENLAGPWVGDDKDAIQEAKKKVIDYFGGASNLKDYVDGPFQEQLTPFLGIARLMPIANNIKSFYARRNTTKKSATIQVVIGGVVYTTDKTFYESIKDAPAQEKRELILNHPSTVKSVDVPEIC